MDGANCGECIFWQKIEGHDMGLCRRMPPIPVFTGEREDYEPTVQNFWPETSSTDFCGEFRRPKEL